MEYPEQLYHRYRDEALRIMGLEQGEEPPLGWTFNERVWTAATYARIALLRKRELYGPGVLHAAEKEALEWNELAGFDTPEGRWHLVGSRYLALDALLSGKLAALTGQQGH